MVIVVGASRGIGKYLYDEFEQRGIDVIGTYLKANDPPEGMHRVDVTDHEQVSKWITSVSDSLKEVTLINCAGITYNSFAHKADSALWKKVIDVNLNGSFNCIQAVLPIMRAQGFGRIINFSSVVAIKGTPGISAYSASKSALWGMTKSLTQENASLGITINNINLGYSELGMIDQVPEKYLDALIAQIPAKKLCEPKDILLTVQYLMDCSYINGASLDVNGGLI